MPQVGPGPVTRALQQARNWDEARAILLEADPVGERHGYLLWLAWRAPPGAEA